MPRQDLVIQPVGVVNRRDAWDELNPTEVRSRENFLVIGVGDAKVNKKMSGSERLSDTDLGGNFRWVTRYYSGSIAKIFAFNQGDGILYHARRLARTFK